MGFQLFTECPYCHRKVLLIGAAVLRTKGEHVCKGCKCTSNVVIHRALYAIASVSTIVSLIILLAYSAVGDHGDPRGILYVFLPFLIFYILVPFFIKLEPCPDTAVNRLKRKANPIPVVPDIPAARQDKPIELNVGADFKSSFLKAKTVAKSVEVDSSEEMDDRIIDEDGFKKDITSGLDIDISAEISQGESQKSQNDEEKASVTEDEEKMQTIVFEKPSAAADAPAEGNEVSFKFGKKP